MYRLIVFKPPAVKRTAKGWVAKLLAALFLLLAAAVSLHAGGSRDEVLSKADTLIEEKEYDEAIRTLAAYIKASPEKLGDAQKRFQRIVGLREEYNTIAEELLDTLETDPENYDKILDLTGRLTNIESTSKLNTEIFLSRVRVLAAFNSNRARLENILDEGRRLLAAENYRGAITLYASGLDIYRDDFYSSGYGRAAEETISNGIETIGRTIADFNSLENSFSSAAAAVGRLASGSTYENVVEAVSALKTQIDRFSLVVDGFAGVGNNFDSQFVILQASHPELGDASFLPFASRLIRGPAGMNEGMSGAVDRFWNSRLNSAEETLARMAEDAFARAYTDASGGNYQSLPALLDNAERFAAVNLDLLKRRQVFYISSSIPVLEIYGETVPEPVARKLMRFGAMNRSLEFMRSSAAIGEQDRVLRQGGFPSLDSWRQGTIAGAAALVIEETNRTSYHSWISDLERIEADIRAEISLIENYRAGFTEPAQDEQNEENSGEIFAEDIDPDFALAYMEQALGIAYSMRSGMRNRESGSITRAYTISTEEFAREVRNREAEFAEGRNLLNGVPVDLTGVETYIGYYPTEALAIFTGMNEQLALNISSGRALLGRYESEDEAILSSDRVEALYTETRQLLERLTGIQSQAASLSATTRNQIARADALKLEGDRLYQESQAALARNNFEVARDRLQRATSVYHNSLAIQESPSLRSSWDDRLLAFGADIVRVENEIVVRDVRNFVTQARNSYYGGNLEQAEDQLVRAQNRWSATNAGEQPEVVYWLNLVRGALSIQSSRIIAVTAPLYAEMSQLMSEALKNFDEGTRLFSFDRREEGIVRFNNARQKTLEVRLMFPMNQDARLLDLRIDQQMDPRAFNAAFANRINEAVTGTKPNVRSTESFALLQDLAAINPNYPGISQLITQAEIDMGYRPAPPNPQSIARSNELTRLAKTVADTRNSIQYPVAIAQLDEALQLNPANNEAAIVKDQIQTWMTGTGTIVLDNRSYDEYTRALLEFQQGNTLIASSIVEQLLQNPRNQNSTLILELQRRIQSVL